MSCWRLPTRWRGNKRDLTAIQPQFWWSCGLDMVAPVHRGTTSALRTCSMFLRLTELMYLNFKWAFLVGKGKGKTVFVIKFTIISKSKLPTKCFGMTLQWWLHIPREWGIQFAEWHMRLYHNNIWNNNCCHIGHKETLNTGGKAQWISRRLDHVTFHLSTYNIMSPGNLDFANS